MLQEKTNKSGRLVQSPVKAGFKEVTREGWEYELTVNLEMELNHYATASKDRTGLFMGKPSFIPNEETGKLIKDWCNQGDDITREIINDITNNIISEEELLDRIKLCKSPEDLLSLYSEQPVYQETHLEYFTRRKQMLTKPETLNNINQHLKTYSNGTITTNK